MIMSFDMSNVPNTICNLMNDDLFKLPRCICIVCLNDIIVYLVSLEEHMVHVVVLKKLQNHHL